MLYIYIDIVYIYIYIMYIQYIHYVICIYNNYTYNIIYIHIQVSSMLKIKVDTLQTSRDAILERHCCEMMVDI